jgi:hypothetical protein
MQENSDFLQSDDVIALTNREAEDVQDLLQSLHMSYVFKVRDFIDSLIQPLNIYDSAKTFLQDGVSCSVMTTRKNGWVKGTVKVTLQFIPEQELDSPLDEIRNNVL